MTLPSRSLAAGVTALALAGPTAAQITAPYDVLDNVEGSHVLLNSAPVRPMAVDSSNDLWAVNTHDGTVERFVLDGGGSPDPAEVVRVPWGPVSVAVYPGGVQGEELLVVCRNTWALARILISSGETLEIIPLDAEPGDILRVGDFAWVSCMGADSVRLLDLRHYSGDHEPGATAGAFDLRFSEETHPSFRIKSPLFLSLGPAIGGAPTLLVAPLHSGNNTTADGTATSTNGSEEVISLAGATRELPDDDIFLIDVVNNAVTPVIKGLGTLLCGQGLHPSEATFWIANTECNNTLAQTEEELKGVFADNRVSVLDLATFTTNDILLDTGDAASFGTIDSNTTIAQPYALAFHPTNGRVYTAGTGSDNVAELVGGASPAFGREWDLASGSIPRGLLFGDFVDGGAATRTLLLVYCWGSNTIEVHDPASATPAVSGFPILQLSHDPTPQRIREGREIFFDASNSAGGNLSCATCHFDAGADFLAWNLSSGPAPVAGVAHSIDHKGPMVTQTLVGLARLAPFHWRGERQLEDFNQFAFPGLLGHTGPLPADDFQKMKEYLFALANPANPNQNRERVLDGSIAFPGTSPEADPAEWQIDYFEDDEFQDRFACVECHDFPTGTNNELFKDGAAADIPERGFFKPTAFHEIWRKHQSAVPINFVGPDSRAFLGAGISHAGTVPNILNFTNLAILAGTFLDNVTSLIHQWDQGLAPAVHFAFLLNASTVGAAASELTGFLEPQTTARNIDLVVYGTSLIGGVATPMRWFLDRHDTSGKPYRAASGSVAGRDLNDFLTGAQLDGESNVFMGLPVGMGQRVGVDFDLDGIFNEDEATVAQQLIVDPGGVPGPPTILTNPFPVAWETTRATRVTFDTSEPTLGALRFREVGTTLWTLVVDAVPQLGTTHSIVLTDLRPSTDTAGVTTPSFPTETVSYEIQPLFQDIDGTLVAGAIGTVTTDPFITPDPETGLDPVTFEPATNEDDRLLLEEHVINTVPVLSVAAPVGPDDRVDVTVDFTTAFKAHGGDDPALDRMFVVRVWRKLAGSDALELLDSQANVDFTGSVGVADVTLDTPLADRPLDVAGPFLLTDDVTILNAGTNQAEVDMAFTLINWVDSGDEILVTVEAVVEVNDAAEYLNRVSSFNCTVDCEFLVPVNSTRAWTQWDFPSTTEHRFMVSAPVP